MKPTCAVGTRSFVSMLQSQKVLVAPRWGCH
jgi:hypothetical protein